VRTALTRRLLDAFSTPSRRLLDDAELAEDVARVGADGGEGHLEAVADVLVVAIGAGGAAVSRRSR
jgi:hypothetical protein